MRMILAAPGLLGEPERFPIQQCVGCATEFGGLWKAFWTDGVQRTSQHLEVDAHIRAFWGGYLLGKEPFKNVVQACDVP